MKINRAAPFLPAFSCAALLLVSACAAPPVVPPAPPPPAPKPAAPPPPPAPAQSLKDWRDAPQTPGDWRFEMRAEGGIARFGTAQGTLFALSCNREARTITLVRTGSSAVSLPMTVATTSETRPLSAEPAPRDEPHLLAPLGLQDTLLDAMAFSRGRFLVEVNGLPTLYLPAWAEVGRVVEDCRGR